MKHLILLSLISAICACSLVKTREEVKVEQKAIAAEEEPAPIDDSVINDSLAELGVDPDGKNPNATPQPGSADEASDEATSIEPSEVASTENTPPSAAKIKKSKKKPVKKTKSKTR